MNLIKAFSYTLLFISLIGCANNHKSFKVSKAQIKNNVQNIAVMWLGLPEQLNFRYQELESYITSEIKSNLIQANITVLTYEEVKPIYQEVKKNFGGIYDQTDGTINKEQLLLIKKETFKRLKTKYQVDSFLYHDIRVTSAQFLGQWAYWHDQRESVYKNQRGVVEDVLIAMFVQERGMIPGLSYCAFLVDSNNDDLYSQCGGIELISKLVSKAIDSSTEKVDSLDIDDFNGLDEDSDEDKTEYSTNFEYLTVDSALQDKEKISNAVHNAFKSLIQVKQND